MANIIDPIGLVFDGTTQHSCINLILCRFGASPSLTLGIHLFFCFSKALVLFSIHSHPSCVIKTYIIYNSFCSKKKILNTFFGVILTRNWILSKAKPRDPSDRITRAIGFWSNNYKHGAPSKVIIILAVRSKSNNPC